MSFRSIHHWLVLATLVWVCLALVACSGNNAEGGDGSLSQDSIARQEELAQRKKLRIDSIMKRFPRIGYHRVAVTDRDVLDSLRRLYAKTDSTFTMYRIITLLNRKDLQFMRVGDTLVMPDSNYKDILAYSLFPQYWPGADTIKKIVVVSPKWQSYACYEYGVLVRFAATNSGEERKPSFPGRYAVNWKQRLRISSLNEEWELPYTVNIHQHAGSAFHQFEMPGRPVSHSCFRQFMHDAEWLFKWVRQAKYDTVKRRSIPFSGTPVIVLDVFDFSRRRGGPWLELESSQDLSIDLPPDPVSVEEALIPISQVPHDSRGSLRNIKRYITADSVLRELGIIRDGVTLRESINYNKLKAKKEAAKKEAAKKRALENQKAAENANN
jgi:hypothetical protein